DKALGHLERPAAFLDRLFKPRLKILATPPGSHLVGAAALVVAGVMPLLEFIPFSATVAGAALTAFGLSLITRDGYMAIVSLATTGGVILLLGRHLMSL
ncbi:MAG: exopolysaccharide biosynthesis protein, partial [Wenzhouxiangella sp.]|nr:exopolysaccharide biosynthesis protein [Wenzhouxiangella sp.]